MSVFLQKRTVIIALLVVLGGGLLAIYHILGKQTQPAEENLPKKVIKQQNPIIEFKRRTIGTSVEGRTIEAYSFGNGPKHLVFVGGIHGGYEWNSVLLAYQFIDYLQTHPDSIPDNLTVSVIPSANPDGVYKSIGENGRFSLESVPQSALSNTTGDGRFNAHDVDLNRNFDCKWKPQSMWRGKKVKAGSAAFSEPESRAIRDFLLESSPQAVVFWHSQSNAVYASECTNGILPETRAIMNIYAQAAGYKAIDTFDSYEVTGDAEGWLASVNIPAITVELKTHETIEWEENLKGITALFKHYEN